MEKIRTGIASLAVDLPPTYWLLWLGTLINRLGSFVIPFLTLYLTSQRGISVNQAALTVSFFGAGSFAARLVGGELADRLGRRPVLLISLLVTPVVTVLLGWVRTLAVIAVCTLFLGFFNDLYRPAQSAMLADLVPASARVRAFGYQYWAVNLGFSLAPILAGLMARYNYILLFVGDAFTTLLFGLIVLFFIPETQPSEAGQAAHISLLARVHQVRRDLLLMAFSGLRFFLGLIYMQCYVTLPLDMQAHGLTSSDYGLAIAVNGILIVAISLPLSHAASNWPRFRAMAISALFIGIGFGLNGFGRAWLPFYFLTVAVWTLGEIITSAVAPAIIADLSPVDLRGAYMGIYGSAWGLAYFIGPLAGGWVFEHNGPLTLWLGCFLLSILLASIYGWIGARARRRVDRLAPYRT